MSISKHIKSGCFLLSIVGTLVSCKKGDVPPENVDPVVSPTTGTRKQFTLDSIYLYARQIYLWNDILPEYTTFNPRAKYAGYNPEVLAYQTELFNISQLKINPATHLPYEDPIATGSPKYSFLEKSALMSHGKGTVAITAGSTAVNTVAAHGIYNAGNIRVGYIALSGFPALSVAKNDLDAAFASIASEDLSKIIIDLRSNSGGYVETAAYVADLIIPSSYSGQVSYTEQFNNRMQAGDATILKYQPYLDENGVAVKYQGRAATMADVDYTEAANTYYFSKKGTLQNIRNVYFIVGEATASASELLINCLKPYFNVKLTGSKTYGKPVGFIGISIETYTVYLSNFLIKNALGNADYFSGMEVDIPSVPDNLYELGDPEETCLKATLNYIRTGKITASKTIIPNSIQAGSETTPSAPATNHAVWGMREHRFKLKKQQVN